MTDSVPMGRRYENVITADSGFVFGSKTIGTRLYYKVTMGGVDVTDSVTTLEGDNGFSVYIAGVVGNVVVTTSTTIL